MGTKVIQEPLLTGASLNSLPEVCWPAERNHITDDNKRQMMTKQQPEEY